jgi:hypothetical protein
MKIKLSTKRAKILDYLFCTVYIAFAFWADWRVGVAFLAFDVMRVFEDIQKDRVK